MSIYGNKVKLISEGLFFGNKKQKMAKNAIETPEQLAEYKDLINQINKIGPSIVDKYNRDAKLVKKLKDDIAFDMKVPKGQGYPDVTKNIKFRFKFRLEEDIFNGTNEAYDDNGKFLGRIFGPIGIYHAKVYIFDDSVYHAMKEFWEKVADDVGFDHLEEDIIPIQNDIGKEIVSKLHTNLLSVSYQYYDNIWDGLQLTFKSKK